MKNYNSSLAHPSSWESPHTSLEENEEYLPITSHLPTENTISNTGPQTEALNLGNGHSSTADGGAGEVSNRKPRGRPRGSKNKPRHNLEEKAEMNVTVLEVPPEADVLSWVVQFAQSKCLCVTVLSASGSISLVDLCLAGSTNRPFTISGPLKLVSFSGTFLWPSSPLLPSPSFFTASLMRFDQQMFAGVVASRMMALSPVVVVVTTFSNPDIIKPDV